MNPRLLIDQVTKLDITLLLYLLGNSNLFLQIQYSFLTFFFEVVSLKTRLQYLKYGFRTTE